MVQLVESRGEIPRFYAGRSVFITGATGFMGKVLLERLLSTCPDISRLYLLLREKRDLAPEKRLTQLKQSQVFDVLQKTNPRQLDKLVVIPGDTTRQDLGMSQESIAMMQEVSVVFHIAATVKFNEELSRAIEQNVRSVLRAMDVCDKLNNMQAFVYVSTAYCNAELYRVEERVYPPPVHHRQLLERAADEMLRDDTTSQLILPKPNTYTFSKAIAEHMVEQRVTKYSTAIFRPTIVVSSLQHPFPGWIDNFNGPAGIIAVVGKGLMRVIHTRVDARADLLPVDIGIDTLIAVAWETSVDKLPDVRVYNCTTGENPTTWKTFGLAINKYLREYPLDNVLWYPHIKSFENKMLLGLSRRCSASGMFAEARMDGFHAIIRKKVASLLQRLRTSDNSILKCIAARYIHKTLSFLLETIPSYLIKYSSRLVGSKSQLYLMSAYKKMESMDESISVFTMKEWHFVNDNVVRLRNRLSEEDAAIYNLDPKTIVWHDHLRDFVIGTRKYILKERDENLQAARRRMRVLSVLHHGSILTVFFVAIFFINRMGLYNAILTKIKIINLRRRYNKFAQ